MDHVTLLWFGPLKDRLPEGERRVALEPGDTVSTVFKRVFADHPEVDLPVAYAQDATYVSADTPARPGAEVAAIPPVGGG